MIDWNISWTPLIIWSLISGFIILGVKICQGEGRDIERQRQATAKGTDGKPGLQAVRGQKARKNKGR